MRVFELAKKLKMPSKELLKELQKLGISAKNHMTSLEDADVKRVQAALRKGTEPAAPVKKATRVLIKKKRVEPAPEETVEEIQPAAEAQEAAPEEAVKPAAAAPSVETAETPQPLAATAQGAPATGAAEGVEESKEKARAPLSPPPSGVTEVEKKEKRKLLKTDLFELAKQEISNRYKEKFKKGRKPKRGRDAGWREMYPDTGRFREGGKGDGGRRDLAASGSAAEITKPRKKVIKLTEGITVKDFAELIGQKSTEVIRKLMEMGTMVTLNQPMDLDAAALLAEGYGLKSEISLDKTEEELIEESVEESPEDVRPRPPVVTIMGHVDHGKTSLLDAIRQTKVAAGEAGGITQHIGAYSVQAGERTIVFLDTPGHEAFTTMRARGAKITDIVVLVVAADDGVMPQTVEAINHARAANVPIVVAINKIDKPDANPDRVKNALAEYNLIPEAWGGQTIFVEVSAKQKLNINTLLEMILLQSDVLELKANPKRLAKGVVIEAKMAKGRGPVATVLIEEGTLKVGDVFVAGVHSGRVRGLVNDDGEKVEQAGPSMPVEVIGFPGVPQAGDTFAAVLDEQVAREIALARGLRQRTAELAASKAGRPVSLEDLYSQIQEGAIKELKLILRADVQGSVEALKESLEKLNAPAVKLNVIHAGVGAVTETDIMLASASNAIVIGFNIRPDPKAAAIAESEKVDIRLYTVIYDAINDVKQAMEGLLEPTLQERILGRCEVREVFNITKVGTIAGAYVTEGTLSRASSGARVVRDGKVVYEGKVGSLRRFKDDVREVQTGYECGIGIENFNDIKQGDVIEVFTIDKIAAKL
jgi:translation initiation factor IF-2